MHCKVRKKIVSLKKTYRQGSEKKMQAAKERLQRSRVMKTVLKKEISAKS